MGFKVVFCTEMMLGDYLNKIIMCTIILFVVFNSTHHQEIKAFQYYPKMHLNVRLINQRTIELDQNGDILLHFYNNKVEKKLRFIL